MIYDIYMYIYIYIYIYVYIDISIFIYSIHINIPSIFSGDHWSHPSKLLRLQDFDIGSYSPRWSTGDPVETATRSRCEVRCGVG